eukprot:scaffold965_cov118-Skeletonema_marinoi.AAC.1
MKSAKFHNAMSTSSSYLLRASCHQRRLFPLFDDNNFCHERYHKYRAQSTMAPTLYHVPRTISSPIVQILLELGVKDVNIETLTFAELKSPAHLARNPMGSSPAFTDEDNGIAIWESGAVLTYLLETYDTQHKFHPKQGTATPLERANFLHLQQYIIATVYPFLASLFLQTLKPEHEQDQGYISSAKEKWLTLLAPTLTGFLGGQPFFMGNAISSIDFLIAKPLNNAKSLDLLEQFPDLDALFKRVSCMPSFAKAYDMEERTKDCSGCTKDCTECRSLVLLPN